MGFVCVCASLVFPHDPTEAKWDPSLSANLVRAHNLLVAGRSIRSIGLACPRAHPRSASNLRLGVSSLAGDFFSRGGWSGRGKRT